MFLNSTRNGLIWIEDLDQEIEGEEPFQSRIGLSNFGAKRCSTFAGVDLGYETPCLLSKRESEMVRWLFVACTFVAVTFVTVTFVAVTFVAPKIMSFMSRLNKSDSYVAPSAYVALIVDGMSFSKLVSDLL
jgi:hypothetical protein